MREIEFGLTLPTKEPVQAAVKTRTKREKEVEPQKESEFKFEVQKTRYSDVIGMKRTKAILHKLLELPLKRGNEFEQLGMKKSVGIILYGPPGVGKTFLSKAVSGELNLRMCYVEANQIMQKYVGDSSKKVHEVFDQARTNQPDILFIDEADSLLQDREKISGEGGSQELKQAVSQTLIETSIIHDDKKSCVFMIAATNRPWDIDMAHKRSGRFEYVLYTRPPNFWERRKLFQLYFRSLEWTVRIFKGEEETIEYFNQETDADAFARNLSEEESAIVQKAPSKYGAINYSLLSLATSDYSPADLEKIVKVAKLNSLERKKVLISTRAAQKALWSKEAGKSSLDEWYTSMFHKYLPRKRNLMRSLVSRRYRELEDEKAKSERSKFDKADMDIYKEMVDDIIRYHNHKWFIKIVRCFGRGLPVMY